MPKKPYTIHSYQKHFEATCTNPRARCMLVDKYEGSHNFRICLERGNIFKCTLIAKSDTLRMSTYAHAIRDEMMAVCEECQKSRGK